MIRLILLLALGQTPEATPTPVATPVPDTRPTNYSEDRAANVRRPLVTADDAPEDYVADRWRGTVPYDSATRNYSFHRVVLPAGPLTISNSNFSQAKAGTVVFFRVRDQGVNATANAAGDTITPDNRTPVAADVGCALRFAPAPGWTRGIYRVTARSGGAYVLDRAAAQANATGGRWRLVCPVRDFSAVTFDSCNLTNAWLPASVLRPTLTSCNTTQVDLP